MNKTDFVSAVAKRTGQGWDATKAALDGITAEIQAQNEAGEKVQIPGFGSFDIAHTKARQGRNPSSGATIDIPAKAKPKFTPADAYQTAVNKAQAKV